MPAFVRMTIIVTCLAVLAGCSRERRDWQSAQTADTIEAYGEFLEKHGDSPLAAQAETRVKQLGEERDWQRSATADTLEAYQAYLRQHPEGKWAGEARIRVENFALAGALPGAPAVSGGVEAPAAPAAPVASVATPAPVQVATPARAVPSRTLDYGVQLGAFSSEAKANAEWQRLARAHGGELAGLSGAVTAVKSGAGTLYRLRAETTSEAAARKVCTALRAKGQACVVVLPVGK
ncbi:MAG: SPOR domain-containing protein [Steroidobacteraceae bacterium]